MSKKTIGTILSIIGAILIILMPPVGTPTLILGLILLFGFKKTMGIVMTASGGLMLLGSLGLTFFIPPMGIPLIVIAIPSLAIGIFLLLK